jgi:hypothetical protein
LVTLGSNTLHYAATFKQHEVLEVLLQNPQVRPIGMGHGENMGKWRPMASQQLMKLIIVCI